MTLETFAQKVRELREAQTRYRKAAQRGTADRLKVLAESKAIEKEIDTILKELEEKEAPNQSKLF